MPLPDDIIKLAARGTASFAKPNNALFNSAQYSDTLRESASQKTETDLLLKVVTIKLKDQAGYQPPSGATERYPPAPPDSAKTCSGRAIRHLLLMIAEEKHLNLLPVWLSEMTATNQRVPDEILPLLLTHGNNEQGLRHQLLPVIGERGKWLANISNNSRWRWVLDDEINVDEIDMTTMWQEYLTNFRKRDPIQARELLELHWDDISQTHQTRLMNCLQEQLSEDDEAFLLSQLDSNIMSVMRMICSLENSTFSKDLRQFVGGILDIKQVRHNDNWVIDFTWSRTMSKKAEQIINTSCSEVVQEFIQRWTFEEMLSFIPLSFWYERWQTTPEILVKGSWNSTHPSQILQAWARTAFHQRDSDFTFELLKHVKPNRFRQAGLRDMISILTDDQKDQIAIQWLDQVQKGIHEDHPAKLILQNKKQRWSNELMRAFLTNLEGFFTNTIRPLLKSDIRSLIKQVVPYFSLEMLDEVKRVLMLNQRPELTESELEVIDDIVAGLEFQKEMIYAIRNREA